MVNNKMITLLTLSTLLLSNQVPMTVMNTDNNLTDTPQIEENPSNLLDSVEKVVEAESTISDDNPSAQEDTIASENDLTESVEEQEESEIITNSSVEESSVDVTENSESNEDSEIKTTPSLGDETSSSSEGQSKQTRTIQSGTWGTCPWTFDDSSGVFTIQSGELSVAGNSPWNQGIVNVTAIKKIIFEPTVVFPSSCLNLFKNIPNITSYEGFENVDTSRVTNMSSMFWANTSLKSLDLSTFDTSNVTDFYAMFYVCEALVSLDVSNFKTGQAKNMGYMFSGLKLLKNLDVSGFDTTNVEFMNVMFNNCYSLVNLDVSKFKTEQVTRMDYMFTSCRQLGDIDVKNFDTSKVTDMRSMFQDCQSLETIDVSNFITANMKTMIAIFRYCSNLRTILQNFDTSKASDIGYMFDNCNSIEALDISNFDTTNVTSMKSMLNATNSLKQLTLGDNFKFLSDNGLGEPSPGLRWQKINIRSNAYNPTDFTDNYGRISDLTAGTYVAEGIIPQELTISEGIVGNEINMNFSANIHLYESVLTQGLTFRIDFNKLDRSLMDLPENMVVDLIDAQGTAYESITVPIQSTGYADLPLSVAQLSSLEKMNFSLTGTAWNNTPDNTAATVDILVPINESDANNYQLSLTSDLVIRSGRFGFIDTPDPIEFQNTLLFKATSGMTIARKVEDWKVTVEDYRGTNQSSIEGEDSKALRTDWELVATTEGFRDSNGELIASDVLGIGYKTNGNITPLSATDEVPLYQHSVAGEIPKENHETNIEWAIDNGLFAVVQSRFGLKTDITYTAEINYEIRQAP